MAEEEKPVELSEDQDGWPILLATRAAGQVAAQRTSGVVAMRGAASGNRQFDPASGRFAGKSPGRTVSQQGGDVVVVQQTRTLPQGVTKEQWEKRQDAIRNVARNLATLDPTGVKTFLENHPGVDASKVNLDLFIRDARAQQLDDLVDIYDAQLHDAEVKVTSAGSYARNALKGLSQQETLDFTRRLEGRGWSAADVNKNVVKHVKNPQTLSALQQVYGESKPKRGRKAQ